MGGAVRGLLWSSEALVTGLDLDGFVSFAGSPRSGVGVSSLLSMVVLLLFQVTDFAGSAGHVSSAFSTV